MRHRQRQAVSVIVAEIILIAIAVSVGYAVWSFVQGAAGARSQEYAEANAAYINFLNERLSIIHIEFPDATTARVWVLNWGEFNTNVTDVVVVDVTVPATPATLVVSSNTTTIPKGGVASVNVTCDATCGTFPAGSYHFTIVGQYTNRDGYLVAKPS